MTVAFGVIMSWAVGSRSSTVLRTRTLVTIVMVSRTKVMELVKYWVLFGRVVATKLTAVTVEVVVNGLVTVNNVSETTSTVTSEVSVTVSRNCVERVVNTVPVSVVRDRVRSVLVDADLVVRNAVAMAKLVKMVWVLVNIRYFANSVVSKNVTCVLTTTVVVLMKFTRSVLVARTLAVDVNRTVVV